MDNADGVGVGVVEDCAPSCSWMTFFLCQDGDLKKGALGTFLSKSSTEGVVKRDFELLVDGSREEK